MGCKNLSRHTFITTLLALLLHLMRVTHKFPHSLQCCDDSAALSGQHSRPGQISEAGLPAGWWGDDVSAHDIRQASICRRNMDAGSSGPPCNMQKHHSVQKHQLCWWSEKTFVMVLLGCFVTWWLLHVLYLGSCFSFGCSESIYDIFSLQSVSTTSLLPVYGLSVSAAATAVMFILSATPPPLCTQTRNAQSLLGSFIRGWYGGVSGCLFVGHVTN